VGAKRTPAWIESVLAQPSRKEARLLTRILAFNRFDKSLALKTVQNPKSRIEIEAIQRVLFPIQPTRFQEMAKRGEHGNREGSGLR
jgi:hypothetical protein